MSVDGRNMAETRSVLLFLLLLLLLFTAILWYYHTYRWPSRARVHGTATYRV